MYVPVQQNFIERIHASGKPLVIAVTGGGSGAIAALLQVPGASATVLEAVVPYSAAALHRWLGGRPDQYCSERTARAMAMASFQRALDLSEADPLLLRGIGSTASLATTRPKRGPHRIHVAWQSADTTVAISSTLSGANSRAEEEQLATDLILNAIAEACGIAQSMSNQPISSSIERREQRAPAEWSDLLLGRRNCVAVMEKSDATSPMILFPGAFNPLHPGHTRMAEIAAEMLGRPVTFELSIINVDKPLLDFIEIADRLAMLQGKNVLLTRAATFVEKAQLAPGCVFIVGVDTLIRTGDPVYYGGDAARRDVAIETLAESRCRFLVFGRAIGSSFQSLANFNVPPALRALCDEVPESTFREDVSSSKLRGT